MKIPVALIKKITNPGLMFGFSSLGRAVSYILPIPLIQQILGAEAVAFWLAIVTIISIQNLFFLGLPQVIVRTLAHSFAKRKLVLNSQHAQNGEAKSLKNAAVFLKYSFLFISIMHVIFLGIFGSLALERLINLLNNPSQGWLTWGIIVGFSLVRVHILRQLTFLNGMDDVAIPRMLDGVAWCLGGLISAISLWYSHSLVLMVLFANLTNILCMIILELRCRKLHWVELVAKPEWRILKQTTIELWKPAWRTGLATLIAAMTRQGLGLYYAQVGEPKMVAAYLLTINAISVVTILSAAPIMSRVHTMTFSYAAGDKSAHAEQLYLAIKESIWVVVLLCGVGGFIAYPILILTGHSELILPPEMWFLMSLTLLFQRFSSAHLQSYSVTNHIIWHWLDGFAGIATIFLTLLTVEQYGLWGILWSSFLSILMFYSWIPSLYSYRLLKLKFPAKDIKHFLLAVIAIFVLFGLTIVSAMHVTEIMRAN